MAHSTGLFSSLAKYASSERVSPLENFATELLAWMINESPEFGRRVASCLLSEELDEHATVQARTQRGIPGGFIDLWMSVAMPSGRRVDLLVEDKIESGVGVRFPGQTGSRGAQETKTQLDTYLEFAKKHAPPDDLRVVLVSKYPETYAPTTRLRDKWLVPRRWHEVGAILGQLAAGQIVSGAEEDARRMAWISREAMTFLKENDMVLEPVGPALLEGSPERPKLIKLFVETAEVVSREVGSGLHVGQEKSDRWGAWIYLKKGKENLAGLGYSDRRGTAFLGIVDPYAKDKRLVADLKEHASLRELREPVPGEFWGTAVLQFKCFQRPFFSLSADGQIRALADEAGSYLRAIIEVLDR